MADAASINVADAKWEALAEACRRLPRAASGADALRGLVASAVRATGTERGFIVTFPDRPAPGRHRIDARFCRRSDGERSPSRNVLEWAASVDRPGARIDLEGAPQLFQEVSVRAMKLRHVAAAPVPASAGPRRSFVVDSRQPPDRPPAEILELLEVFAALAASLTAAPAGNGVPPPELAEQGPPELVGRSPAFLSLLALTRRVAPWRLPVLLTGESGSGKEGIARTLHHEGPRADGPFVAVNCSAVPESLLESELFGSVRGSFTGAEHDRPGLFRLASGGTLFLDEVGDMPLMMQAKLLRVLQENSVRPVGGHAETAVDVRVVAATHRCLAELVQRGAFRHDLYYRLAVVELRVPPLRERREDIPLLVEHTLRRLERSTGIAPIRVGRCAMEALSLRPWPGNVRQLEATLAQALVRAHAAEILAGHLELNGEAPDESGPGRPAGLEKAMILAALSESGGNRSDAASLIGWSRPKLYRRLRALGIPARRGARKRSR